MVPELLRAVLKVHCQGAAPSYVLPWQVEEQESWTGSGFLVRAAGRTLVVTNAHVVLHAFVVRVSEQSARKRLARVLCVAPDLDLALLDADYAPAPAPALAPALPELFSVVSSLGFPEGGSTVCVTKGVVSRVDAQAYAHLEGQGLSERCSGFPGRLLILQVDAAINAGSSGGPALSEAGEVVGVASSGLSNAQNVGYIIPVPVLAMFLAEFERTGCWSGVCELGFVSRPLESEALRRYYGVGAGVLTGRRAAAPRITDVAPLGAAAALRAGDVLLAVDGREVQSDGTARLLIDEREVVLALDHFVTSKRPGEEVVLRVQRQGAELSLRLVAGPCPQMLPRYCGVDARASFAIFGGLVFTRLSVPLLQELCLAEDAPAARVAALAAAHRWPRERGEELVVLLRVLHHPINEGVCAELQIVTHVNGEAVRSLAGLVQQAQRLSSAGSGFLRFSFSASALTEEVLPVEGLREADEEILAENGIAGRISSDLARKRALDVEVCVP
jgi:S1-C subfamily serine protease